MGMRAMVRAMVRGLVLFDFDADEREGGEDRERRIRASVERV